nr:hypothetical protein [Streptomyces cyanogenus]
MAAEPAVAEDLGGLVVQPPGDQVDDGLTDVLADQAVSAKRAGSLRAAGGAQVHRLPDSP